MSTLISVKPPQYQFLVFTSAGNYAQVSRWCQGNINFDLWITYYGNEENKYQEYATYWNARKGTKFPNLLYIYQQYPELLDRYQAIWVADDDVIISGSDISRLFELREQYDLWIAQPAFDPLGKISFDITCVQPLKRLRYTNFIEVTCPLFRKDKLDQFMEIYNPELVGYGIDAWFLDTLYQGETSKIAIIDDVPCKNPYDFVKDGIREIDKIQSLQDRIATFNKMRQQYNIIWDYRSIRQFKSIAKPWDLTNLFYALKVWGIHYSKKVIRPLFRVVKNLRRKF